MIRTTLVLVMLNAMSGALVGAQETATLTPPPTWLAVPVDAAHTYAFGQLKTIGKWTPPKKSATTPAPPGAIYFAVGDANGQTLDALAGAAIVDIPRSALHANTQVKICGDTDTGWLFEYVDSRRKMSIERAVAMHENVAAIATYERPMGSPEDPLARASLLTLCAASEPSD